MSDPHLCQLFILSLFFILTALNSMHCYIIMVLICISVRKDEHLFVCLQYFFLWNISSYTLFIFYLDCLLFFTCWVLRVLHICSRYESFDRNRDCGLSFHPINRGFCRATKKPLDESESGEWKSWLKVQHSENENHGIRSHHFMGNRWGNSVRHYFSGLQNHCRWWLQPWN